ncbi:MAG: hypothetical protein ACLRQY_08400 [[Clostridium] leptum]
MKWTFEQEVRKFEPVGRFEHLPAPIGIPIETGISAIPRREYLVITLWGQLHSMRIILRSMTYRRPDCPISTRETTPNKKAMIRALLGCGYHGSPVYRP